MRLKSSEWNATGMTLTLKQTVKVIESCNDLRCQIVSVSLVTYMFKSWLMQAVYFIRLQYHTYYHAVSKVIVDSGIIRLLSNP